MQSEETSKPDNSQDKESKTTNESNITDAAKYEEPAWSLADDAQKNTAVHDNPEVSWSASEFIAHHKGPEWYLALAVFGALVVGLIYLITSDKITSAAVAVALLAFGLFASKQPRTLNYKLDESGLTIAEKHYSYAGFKSFSVQEDEAIVYVFLLPMQRFAPGLTIYFPPEQENKIVGTLTAYLPQEERPPDALDRLMRKVRF